MSSTLWNPQRTAANRRLLHSGSSHYQTSQFRTQSGRKFQESSEPPFHSLAYRPPKVDLIWRFLHKDSLLRNPRSSLKTIERPKIAIRNSNNNVSLMSGSLQINLNKLIILEMLRSPTSYNKVQSQTFLRFILGQLAWIALNEFLFISIFDACAGSTGCRGPIRNLFGLSNISLNALVAIRSEGSPVRRAAPVCSAILSSNFIWTSDSKAFGASKV